MNSKLVVMLPLVIIVQISTLHELVIIGKKILEEQRLLIWLCKSGIVPIAQEPNLSAVTMIPSYGLNVGLIAGDNKRLSSPLIIRKVAKLSPVFININSGLPKITKLPPLPKLPPKPPPLRLSEGKLPKPKRSLLSPVPPLLLPPLPPLPLLPILPILPPLLPPLPIIPRLPIIPPLPILPPVLSLSKLKDPLKPLRVSIIGKPPLLKPLSTKLKPINIKRDILAKLLDLKIKGSLTTPEYIRFKKLLVK